MERKTSARRWNRPAGGVMFGTVCSPTTSQETHMKWLRNLAVALSFLGGAHGALADGFVYDPFKFLDGPRFTVDVAMDGSTWRFDDGSNPFYPTFTGALARGKTFIVSGNIYKG